MSGKGGMSNYTAVANRKTAAATLREQHVRRVVDAAQDSHSASTRRNYLATWRRFETWADREGLSPMPALPETVAAYLAERAANGLSPASLRLDRAAIRYHHTEAGHANPADNEGVRRVLRGLTRRAAREGRTPKQAAALTEEGLAAIRETAQLRRTGPGGRTERASKARRRGQVDIALASVMRDAMLRRSEAAALTWADVAFRSDGSARVTVRRSKSDQDGTGATMYVGRAAAAELRAIHRPDASPKAPVFGLRSGRAVSNRIAAAARAAGLRRAVSRDTHPGSGWPVTWWPRAKESLPSRSPDAGLPPKCPPTTPAPNWPRREPWPGSTGRIRWLCRGYSR